MTRSNTKERYFTVTDKSVKHRPGKANQSRADTKIKNKATECPECQSMNCKQRRFDIKCYNCGVVIEDD